MLRVLAITNMFPTPQYPALGTFVEQQVIGLRRIGLDMDVMFVNRTERGMRSYFTTGSELRNRIEQFQPDVVHVMYGGVLAEQVTRIVKDRPTVVSFCGSDLLGEPLSGLWRRIISEWGVLASHIAARRAIGIVVKSRNLEEALPAAVTRSKVRIIPNGIDFERFRPLDQADCRQVLQWDVNKFHVLFPGYSSVKQPHLARAAMVTVNRLGLNAEMHHLEGVPHKEVSIWLNASDVVLLTSLHEGSPNIIKEALACDVAVVSVDVGDVRERVGGIDGCHIAQPDPQDLGAKLVLVRSRGGRIAGRERVEPLSLEQTSLNLMHFYQERVEVFQKQGITKRSSIDANTLLEFSSSILARRKISGRGLK
ncbi:MAG TPA: glycosyltransferase [Nitrospira sp.]|nr:glycosyltransferase [Nitrospira sp.]